jgi:hypothetical protein
MIGMLICNHSQSQTLTFEWAKKIGSSTGYDLGNAAAVDAHGNLYAAGNFEGTVDFDPGPAVANLTTVGSSREVFIQKWGPAGNYLWAKRVGGPDIAWADDLVLDAANNVYVMGTFGGTSDFDPGPGVFNLTAINGGASIFFLKLDVNGNFVWARSLDNEATGGCRSIAVDSVGNLFAVGRWFGTVDFDMGPSTVNRTSAGSADMYVMKLNSNGNFAWVKTIGGTGSDYWTMADLDSGSNVYMIGSFSGMVDFDPNVGISNLNQAGGLNCAVMKMDSSGNYLWATNFGGASPVGIALDPFGNIYTSGRFGGTADFDPGTGTFNVTVQGNIDGFVQKLTPAGNFIWARTYGGASSSVIENDAIFADRAGDVYCGGLYSGTIDFDPGPGANIINGNFDMYVQKLDSAGNFNWARVCGNINTDIIYDLFVDDNFSVYGTGMFSLLVDFNPTIAISNLNGGSIGYDAPFFKWGQCYNTSASLTQTSCNSFSLNGTNYTSSGTYVQHLTNTRGCDSALTLNLTILQSTSYSIPASTCDSFSLNGVVYHSAGTYTQTLTNSVGCDSIITLHLNFPTTSSTITATGCKMYELNGLTYFGSGNYTQTLQNVAGCDSTIALNLTIINFIATVNQVGQTLLAQPSVNTTAYQWLDCNNGYSPILGANLPTFWPTTAGSYAAIVTRDSCSDTSSCYLFTPVAISNDSIGIISAYPSPNHGQFLLNLKGIDADPITLLIYDAKGSRIWEQTVDGGIVHAIDIGMQVAGIYFIEVTNGESTYIDKFLID